uniref:Uncharacterized protein LOC111115060 n=1 Tax=Crassostrea virginica TaxID=6565 RepID=A0A8B8C2M8_CRAVI|nr:uncharacterized protein LOC111115060 [Crassostrea virginica]
MDILKDISKIGISPVETLQFFTCMLAGIYTGFNLYAVLFEAPSRASLPLHSHWEQWATSFREASKVMPKLSLCMGLSSAAVFYLSPASDKLRLLWLAPIAASIFDFGYTSIFMLPEIKILLENDVITKKGQHWVREATDRWLRRHYPRLVVVAAAFVVVLYATVKS